MCNEPLAVPKLYLCAGGSICIECRQTDRGQALGASLWGRPAASQRLGISTDHPGALAHSDRFPVSQQTWICPFTGNLVFSTTARGRITEPVSVPSFPLLLSPPVRRTLLQWHPPAGFAVEALSSSKPGRCLSKSSQHPPPCQNVEQCSMRCNVMVMSSSSNDS